jgi:hypothetical protein
MDYDVAVKTDRMNATRLHFADGTLEIQASNDDLLAEFTLSATGGSVTGDIWTSEYVSDTVAGAAAGIAAKAVMKNSGGTVRATGITVGDLASGLNIRLNNLNIALGQDVTLSTSSIEHAD